MGFNPHRPRRTGATLRSSSSRSILTCFNPHRPRRTGATIDGVGLGSANLLFQSSPAPKDRCNVSAASGIATALMFQSSPAPKDRCNIIELSRETIAELFQSSPAPKDRCNCYITMFLSAEPRLYRPHSQSSHKLCHQGAVRQCAYAICFYARDFARTSRVAVQSLRFADAFIPPSVHRNRRTYPVRSTPRISPYHRANGRPSSCPPWVR